MNPMREIKIDKLTLNIGCGTDKEKLDRSKKLLEKLTNQQAVITKTVKRNTFGVAKGRPIGVKVTVQGDEAKKILSSVLVAVDNKIKISQINGGNFSIGVKEYIDIPDVTYDPDIGIMGFDAAITLKRPGFRVKLKRIRKSKIGKNHMINKNETIDWVKTLGVEVVGE